MIKILTMAPRATLSDRSTDSSMMKDQLPRATANLFLSFGVVVEDVAITKKKKKIEMKIETVCVP